MECEQVYVKLLLEMSEKNQMNLDEVNQSEKCNSMKAFMQNNLGI